MGNMGWRVYATCWMTAAGAVFAAALVLGASVMGWAAVLLLAALMAVLGACFGVAWNAEPDATRRVGASGAGWGAFGIVVVLGLPPTLGPIGLLGAVALAVTCPWTTALLRRELRRRGGPRRSDVDLISDRELGRRWELTGQLLGDGRRTPAERAAIADERGLLLDELERRDRAGFESWLIREGWLAPLESRQASESES